MIIVIPFPLRERQSAERRSTAAPVIRLHQPRYDAESRAAVATDVLAEDARAGAASHEPPGHGVAMDRSAVCSRRRIMAATRRAREWGVECRVVRTPIVRGER